VEKNIIIKGTDIEEDKNSWERKGKMDQKIYKRKIGGRI